MKLFAFMVFGLSFFSSDASLVRGPCCVAAFFLDGQRLTSTQGDVGTLLYRPTTKSSFLCIETSIQKDSLIYGAPESFPPPTGRGRTHSLHGGGRDADWMVDGRWREKKG
jgi:hypothetical protein